MRETLSFRGIESPGPGDIDDVKRRWQRQRLTWFRGQIPDELRELAEQLDVWGEKPSIEEQEMAEVGFYTGPVGTWGEPRPFTSDELSEQSADKIARLLAEWRPDDRSLETGTRRGLELSFQELAAGDPAKALDVWQAAEEELRPGFTRSLLEGLRNGLKANVGEFEWGRALAFVRSAVEQATTLESTPGSMRRALLLSATDLLEEGASNDLVPAGFEEEVWSTLAAAISQPVSWVEEGAEEEFDSFGGLLTAALNRTGSRQIHAALHAGLWSYRLREGEKSGEASRAAESHLAPILDEVLRRTGSGRVMAEAMIGQFLPQLQLIAPEWLEEHMDELLESGAIEPFKRPVWGAYVSRGRLYDSTFKMLRPWYLRSAQAAATAAGWTSSNGDHWSLTRSLAEHVLIAILRGLVAVGDLDRLVEITFANVPVGDRVRAYWSVFRAWSDTDRAPPEAFVDRLIDFWEWRLDQLKEAEDDEEITKEAEGLGWFLRTPYLPDTGTLRLGVRTASAAKGKLELHTDWDRLRGLAATDVDTVFKIVELVLGAQLAEPLHFVLVDEVKPLLQMMLNRGSPETRGRTQRLVNRLGEAGYDDFRDLVE